MAASRSVMVYRISAYDRDSQIENASIASSAGEKSHGILPYRVTRSASSLALVRIHRENF